MATSFNVNINDLQYILRQIKIAEDSSIGYTPTTPTKTILQSIMDAYGVTAANAAQLPAGLRTVDGTMNNLTGPGMSEYGAADNLFPRLTDPNVRNRRWPRHRLQWRSASCDVGQLNYGNATPLPVLHAGGSSVADADPRMISNLIVDMSVEQSRGNRGISQQSAVAGSFAGRRRGMMPSGER